MIIVVLILVIIYSTAKGISDVLSFRYDRSVFKDSKHKQWLDPRISHVNKYKNGLKDQGEKFFGATTVFVMFTDAWHMLDFIKLQCIIISSSLIMSLSLLYTLIIYLILSILGAGVFNVLYDYVLLSKPLKN